MRNHRLPALVLLATALLTACGGGGGSPAPADTTKPTVVATSPLPGATGVALNPSINVTFSEPINPATLNSSTFFLIAGSSPIPGTISYTGTTASFTPTSSLSYGVVYTGLVTIGVKDLSGNALAADYVWTFSTPPSSPTSHQVTLSWDANREADVNRIGGGYIVAINGQAPITVACPCAAKPSATTTLMSGSYTATITAYTAISKTTGLAGSNSSSGISIPITVPY